MLKAANTRHQRTLFGFGTVALADILANSVVVILLLIVITLKIKEEQIATQRQQSHDINVLLSRQIATSVVMNDLPSSRPAILHDYNSCDIPHDCNPGLYPIIELWPRMVREYNSGLTLTREQLLRETNALDAYLVQLSPDQKRNLRIDVYGVELFYLALDILKEHQVRPYHWHFLGEHQPQPGAGFELPLAEAAEQRVEDNLSLLAEELQLGAAAGSAAESLPLPVSPDGVNLRSAQLWRDSLLPPPWEQAMGGSPGAELSELLPPGASAEQQRIAEMTAQLLQSMQNLQQQQDDTQSFQLRLALTPPTQSEDGGETADLDWLQLLTALLIYLDAAAEVGLSNVDLEPVVAYIQQYPDLADLPQYQRAQRLLLAQEASAAAGVVGLSFKHQADLERLQAPQLRVGLDQRLSAVAIHHHPELALGPEPAAGSSLSIGVRLYPFVDQSERYELQAGSIVIAPAVVDDGFKGWLPALLLGPDLQENLLGYVYAQLDGDQLKLDSAVNLVQINGLALPKLLPANPERGNLALFGMYGALFVVAVLGLLLWRYNSKRGGVLAA